LAFSSRTAERWHVRAAPRAARDRSALGSTVKSTVRLAYSADDGDAAVISQLLNFVAPGARVERQRRVIRAGFQTVEAVDTLASTRRTPWHGSAWTLPPRGRLSTGAADYLGAGDGDKPDQTASGTGMPPIGTGSSPGLSIRQYAMPCVHRRCAFALAPIREVRRSVVPLIGLPADLLTRRRANQDWREHPSYVGRAGADTRVLGRTRTARRKQPRRRRQRPPR
jgi:hypothetical protein